MKNANKYFNIYLLTDLYFHEKHNRFDYNTLYDIYIYYVKYFLCLYHFEHKILVKQPSRTVITNFVNVSFLK